MPYGFAGAISPRLNRWTEVWSDSVTRIEPATPRYALLVMRPAPPRYADVPTPSSTEARVTKDLGSVYGKLYVQAFTGG